MGRAHRPTTWCSFHKPLIQPHFSYSRDSLKAGAGEAEESCCGIFSWGLTSQGHLNPPEAPLRILGNLWSVLSPTERMAWPPPSPTIQCLPDVRSERQFQPEERKMIPASRRWELPARTRARGPAWCFALNGRSRAGLLFLFLGSKSDKSPIWLTRQ